MHDIVSRYTETSNGYVKLYIRGRGVLEEHRYVMEQQLGRRLDPHEVVHHIDGDKQNNAVQNLRLCGRPDHASMHAQRETPMVTLVCAQCGDEFDREASRVRAKRAVGQTDFYCGRSCMGAAFGRGRPK